MWEAWHRRTRLLAAVVDDAGREHAVAAGSLACERDRAVPGRDRGVRSLRPARDENGRIACPLYRFEFPTTAITGAAAACHDGGEVESLTMEPSLLQ